MLTKFSFRKPTASMLALATENGLPEPIHRTAVEIDVPVLDQAAIIEAISNPTTSQLVVDAVNALLIAEVRSQLDDLPNYEEVNLDLVDLSKVTLEAIASKPVAQRTGGGIPEDTWDAWQEDFVLVITTVTDKTEVQATNACGLIRHKLKDVKHREEVLDALGNYMNTYYANTSEANQVAFAGIYQRIEQRIKAYKDGLNADTLSALNL